MGISKDKKHVFLGVATAYIVAVVLLLLVSIKEPKTAKPLQTVEVSIENFSPPVITTLSHEQKEQIDELESKSNDLSSLPALDHSVIDQQINISGNISESAIKTKKIDIDPFSEDRQSQDNELLSSVLGDKDKITDGGSTSKDGQLPGPPGLARGKSFKRRLSKKSRRSALRKAGGTKTTEEALDKALKYLAAHQNPEGSWGGKRTEKSGDIVALSALATLSFLGRGEHYKSEYGNVVINAVNYLLKTAETNGVEYAGKSFGHAILVYALAESYSITGDPRIPEILKKRLQTIIEKQNSLGSYYENYNNEVVLSLVNVKDNGSQLSETNKQAAQEMLVGEPKCDLSLLGWHIQALIACKMAGIESNGIDEVLEKSTGALMQVHQAKGGGFSQWLNAERFQGNLAVTPVGMLSLQLLGYGKGKTVKRAADFLFSHGIDEIKRKYKEWKSRKARFHKWLYPSWKENGSNFPLYRWYYQTQAVFQESGGKGDMWKEWNENLQKELLGNQEADGCWIKKDVTVNLQSSKDRKIYSTALCSLMLEVYYRYLPSYCINEAPKSEESIAARLDAARLGLIRKTAREIDEEAAMLLGINEQRIEPVQFARFNLRPYKPDEKQIDNEYRIFQTMRSTIHIRKPEDFPQKLLPKQRLAFFGDSLLPEGFDSNLLFKLSIASGRSTRELPLQIVFNGKVLFYSHLHSSRQLLEVLLPADKFRPYGNILEVKNMGEAPLALDAACFNNIDPHGTSIYLGAVDADKLPKEISCMLNVGVLELPKLSGYEKYFEELLLALKNLDLMVPKNDSLAMRRTANFMMYRNREALTGKLPEIKDVIEQTKELKAFQRRILELLTNKIEPMLIINETLSWEEIEIYAKLYSPFVKFWSVHGTLKLKATDLIKRLSPKAEILMDSSEYYELQNKETQQLYASTERHRVLGNPNTLHVKTPSTKASSFHSNCSPLIQCKTDSEYRQHLPYLFNADLGNTIRNWGIWECAGREHLGDSFKRYYLRREGRNMIEWISGGATGILLSNMKYGGIYYDTLSGMPQPALSAFRQAAQLFAGQPQKLPANFCTVNSDKPLQYASVVSAMNAKGVVTIVAARDFPYNKELEITAYIPWKGKTRMTLTSGYLPEGSPYAGMSKQLKTIDDTIDINDNIFRYAGHWPEIAVIRLVKIGEHEIDAKQPDIKWTGDVKNSFLNLGSIKYATPEPDWTRKILFSNKRYSACTGNLVRIRRVKSLPVESKRNELNPEHHISTSVEFTTDDKMDALTNSAFLSFSPARDVKNIAMLVKIELFDKKGKKRSKSFPFSFCISGNLFTAKLRSGKWQWLQAEFDEPGINPKFLRIIPPKSNNKDYTYSYEINEICTFEPSPFDYAQVRFHNGKLLDKENQLLVIIGKPQTKGEYRLRNTDNWNYTNISIIGEKAQTTNSASKEIKKNSSAITYDCIEPVNGVNFSITIPMRPDEAKLEALKQYMNNEESALLQNEELSVVVVSLKRELTK